MKGHLEDEQLSLGDFLGCAAMILEGKSRPQNISVSKSIGRGEFHESPSEEASRDD